MILQRYEALCLVYFLVSQKIQSLSEVRFYIDNMGIIEKH